MQIDIHLYALYIDEERERLEVLTRFFNLVNVWICR